MAFGLPNVGESSQAEAMHKGYCVLGGVMTDDLITREAALPVLGEFTNTSWKAPAGMTYEEWEEAGRTLQTIQGAVNWWIGDWLNEGETRYGEKYAQAIEKTGKSYETLKQCKWVSKQYELVNRLTNLGWTHHLIVAALEPDERADILQWAVENDASVTDLKIEKRRRKHQQLAEGTPELPQDKYRVIYADPPWLYGDSGATLSPNYGGTRWHYPSMSNEELAAKPIKELAAEDAVLFLWVTSPKLDEVWPIIEAWGFEYKTSFVWDKVRHNYGYYNSVRHEFLLICGRGKSTPDVQKLHDSVISIERTEHSTKPERFREIIDEIYPYGKRIELFARQPVVGWDTWGNEVSHEPDDD